jgi:hypothetical protein
MNSVDEAIAHAEQLLPGEAEPEGAIDPRWQAIIAVAEFIPSDPDAVWAFLCRWADQGDDDLRSALATCVLEHILEHRFRDYFPRVEAAVRRSAAWADIFSQCWKMGEAEEPVNAAEFDRLERECRLSGRGHS